MNDPNEVLLYLDYAASTPVAEEVVDEMARVMRSDLYANPSSDHVLGRRASEEIERVREKVIGSLGVDGFECIFTSGATESINLALRGFSPEFVDRIIITDAEHSAMLGAAGQAKNEGRYVSSVGVDVDGIIDLGALESQLKDGRGLVSLCHANNETGVMQPLDEVVELVRGYNGLLHLDCAQTFGKLPDGAALGRADMVSFSGHKMYGPKGIGGLIFRSGLRKELYPLLYGGGQEGGVRPGTYATPQIVGLGAALDRSLEKAPAEWRHVSKLKQFFVEECFRIGGFQLNGLSRQSSPYIVNGSFFGVDSEILVRNLTEFCFSRASACNSGALEPSHVLRAMGQDQDRAYGGFRVSFGKDTREEEVVTFTRRLSEEVARARELLGNA